MSIPQLSFYRNRYYDQRTGRFTQEDPIGLAGGINLYAYVGNIPSLAYTDPFGLCAESSTGLEADSGRVRGAVHGIFCGNTEQLTVYALVQVLGTPLPVPMGSFPAGNTTTNPAGDPNAVDSNGPAPEGTFWVQEPIATGQSPAFGPYFIPVGQGDDIARRRGIGVHGGRAGPQSATEGCIRTSNADITTLATRFRLTGITISRSCQ